MVRVIAKASGDLGSIPDRCIKVADASARCLMWPHAVIIAQSLTEISQKKKEKEKSKTRLKREDMLTDGWVCATSGPFFAYVLHFRRF